MPRGVASVKAALGRLSAARWGVGVAALAVVILALTRLWMAEADVAIRHATVGATPVTVYQNATPQGPAPVVVIAHGFSGSRPLMRAIATSLAQAGYVAASFDFLGHGRHPLPLRGDVTAVDGATAGILGQLRAVADWARDLPGGDGRMAVLGHSMAGDVIARYALEQGSALGATVALSMFSPVVDAEGPGNLLMIVGEWEAGLTDWAVEALAAAHGDDAEVAKTYGEHADGDARRVFFAPNVEHIGVLYSPPAIAEAVDWLNAAFDRDGRENAAARGPWVLALLAGLTALAWPLAALLPPGADTASGGAGLRGRRFWAVALGPAAATPLIAVALDWRFLPVVVGDYLALHFAVYGLLTLVGLKLARAPLPPAAAIVAAAPAAALAALYAAGALGLALDAYVSNFWPVAARWSLLAALAVGMAPYFIADEWLTRGAGAPRFAYPATKTIFLASLAAATALDLERLFFLIILTPAMLLFFIVYGLFSRWTAHATRTPFVGALANTVIFAWAIGVTFPMLAD